MAEPTDRLMHMATCTAPVCLPEKRLTPRARRVRPIRMTRCKPRLDKSASLDGVGNLFRNGVTIKQLRLQARIQRYPIAANVMNVACHKLFDCFNLRFKSAA